MRKILPYKDQVCIGAIFVLLIIISGFTWMTSQGDTAKIKKAKDIIIWSVAGIAIILVSYTLVTFIFSTFGVSSSATTGASTGVTDPNLTPSTPGQDSATVNSSQTDDPPENPGQSTR